MNIYREKIFCALIDYINCINWRRKEEKIMQSKGRCTEAIRAMRGLGPNAGNVDRICSVGTRGPQQLEERSSSVAIPGDPSPASKQQQPTQNVFWMGSGHTLFSIVWPSRTPMRPHNTGYRILHLPGESPTPEWDIMKPVLNCPSKWGWKMWPHDVWFSVVTKQARFGFLQLLILWGPFLSLCACLEESLLFWATGYSTNMRWNRYQSLLSEIWGTEEAWDTRDVRTFSMSITDIVYVYDHFRQNPVIPSLSKWR